MTNERSRGGVLYAVGAVLLLAGGTWWFAAAPQQEQKDARLAQWRTTAERLLPNEAAFEASDTLELGPRSARDVNEPVRQGAYLVSVICAGDDGVVRVTLSTGGDDTGRGVRCLEDPTATTLNVGLGDEFHLGISVEQGGPMVVRYTLLRLA